jgi:hypothetical protein
MAAHLPGDGSGLSGGKGAGIGQDEENWELIPQTKTEGVNIPL